MRPYREQASRYLVFNTRTQKVVRIDAIGGSCVQLPEDHGIIFPGGYYLQTGEFKLFDLPTEVVTRLRFKRMLRSPNGEDVLYVFHEPGSGRYVLFPYNLIGKTVATPILCHGYALFPTAAWWCSAPTATSRRACTRCRCGRRRSRATSTRRGPRRQRLLRAHRQRRAGARHLRADGLARAAVSEQAPTRAAYEDLIRQCTRVADAYFWLGDDAAGGLAAELRGIQDAARTTLSEFEKVDTLRRDTQRALQQAEGGAALADDRHREHAVAQAGGLHRGAGPAARAARPAADAEGAALRSTCRARRLDGELVAEQQRVGERALQFLAGERPSTASARAWTSSPPSCRPRRRRRR